MNDSSPITRAQNVRAGATKSKVPNLLRSREPGIAQRLASFRDRINDAFLDQLASAFLHDPAIRVVDGPPPELKAIALALHVLNKDSWSAEDFKVLDACWKDVTLSDLFSEEFESDRFRIQECVQTSRNQLRELERAFS